MLKIMAYDIEVSPVRVGLAEHVKAEAGGANVARHRVPLRRQPQHIVSQQETLSRKHSALSTQQALLEECWMYSHH